MKKLCILSLFIVINLFFSMSVFAAGGTTYNQVAIPMSTTSSGYLYNGFWMKYTIPNMFPYWSSTYPDQYNKINDEFWFTINNNADWASNYVEMGYHVGYGYNIDGTANYNTTYNGLFISKTTSATGNSLQTFPSKNWQQGQSHTLGNDLYYAGQNFCDMRADGQTVLTYSGVTPSYQGYIVAGLEWATGIGSTQNQYVALPTYITDLNVRVSSNNNWYTWAYLGGASAFSNTHTTARAGMSSSVSNRIDIVAN